MVSPSPWFLPIFPLESESEVVGTKEQKRSIMTKEVCVSVFM